MSTAPDTTPPERIRDLAHKLKRLADDPASPPAEKEAARAKLTGLLDKHGMQMADVFSDAPVRAVIAVNEKDHRYAVQVIGMVLNLTRIDFQYSKKVVVVECTAAQRADLMEAWDHYRPMIAEAKREGMKEKKRLREAMKAVDESILIAFAQKYRIYAQGDNRPKAQLSREELERIIYASNSLSGIKGDAWRRKAGHIDDSGPIDRKHRLNG